MTAPPTWTAFALAPGEPWLVPASERKRLGPAQQDITPGTPLEALDGAIGAVDRVELDPTTGRLAALWVRADGIFAHDMRIPAEWLAKLWWRDRIEERADRLAVQGQHRIGGRDVQRQAPRGGRRRPGESDFDRLLAPGRYGHRRLHGGAGYTRRDYNSAADHC